MNKLITVILLIAALSALGQTADEYLELGMEKHHKKDYKGALKNYTKAIKSNPSLSNAYYNRGTVQLATGELADALIDFSKAIRLDKGFVHAYYSRATVYVSQKNYKASLRDLNKAIELNEAHLHALTLRGQIHVMLKDEKAGCKDLLRATELGDQDGDEYLSKYCHDKKPPEIVIELKTNVDAYKPSAREHFDLGIIKQNKNDYEGAIRNYNKAIELDGKFAKAYFHRGTINRAIGEISAALADLGKAIAYDQGFIQAYYSRATIYVGQNKYAESMPDLNKVIELDEAFPNALTLRGQIHFALADKEACCADFQKAKEFGDPTADKYLLKFCSDEQQLSESLVLHWPDNENWKIANTTENSQMKMIEFLRNNEEFYNWTEMGNMQSLKRATEVPMDKAMGLIYEQSKQACPKTKMTFIEKDERVEFPWVLFTTECASYKDSKAPKSQLWYIVQGKTSLYINSRAIKEAAIPPATQKKWISFFKGGEIVYKNEE